MSIENRTNLIRIIAESPEFFDSASIQRFYDTLADRDNTLLITGIGEPSDEQFDELDEDDEESTHSYTVNIVVGDFSIEMKMLYEFDGGWELTRKGFTVRENQETIETFGEFSTPSERDWSAYLEAIRENLEEAIIEGDLFLSDSMENKQRIVVIGAAPYSIGRNLRTPPECDRFIRKFNLSEAKDNRPWYIRGRW